MKSPVQALMEEYGAPLTRDEYLKWNNLGKGTKVSPEEEAEMPTRFAYPVVTHDTMPTPDFGDKPKPKAKQETPGAIEKPPKVTVHHFNGKSYKTADDKPIKNHDMYIGGKYSKDSINPDVKDEYDNNSIKTAPYAPLKTENYYEGDSGMIKSVDNKSNIEQDPNEPRQF
jgi:hypothetical protein